MQKTAGYTFLELMIVMVVIAIAATAATVNLGPAVATLDIEQVASQVRASVSRAHRAAISGVEEILPRQVSLDKALPAAHPGIALSDIAPVSEPTCTGNCSNGQNTICVSGQLFCYSIGKSFTFESYSGLLTQPRAVFVVSRSRKLAVLISRNGKTDVAELVNGKWRARTELESSILSGGNNDNGNGGTK